MLFKFLSHGREKEVDKLDDADNDKDQDTSATKRNFLHIYFQCRTTFSDEMSANLLHWIVKEMNEYLDALCVPHQIICIFFDDIVINISILRCKTDDGDIIVTRNIK